MLNARGNRGLRIDLADGTRLLIGSQRPETLALALEPGSNVRSSLGVVVIGGQLSALALTLLWALSPYFLGRTMGEPIGALLGFAGLEALEDDSRGWRRPLLGGVYLGLAVVVVVGVGGGVAAAVHGAGHVAARTSFVEEQRNQARHVLDRQLIRGTDHDRETPFGIQTIGIGDGHPRDRRTFALTHRR